MVLHMEVQVGFGRVARVAAKPDNLPLANLVADANAHAPPLQMSQEAVFLVPMVDHHEVAPKIPGQPVDPS